MLILSYGCSTPLNRIMIIIKIPAISTLEHRVEKTLKASIWQSYNVLIKL